MATSMVEKLLADAKQLTNRLKERETLTDKVITTSIGVQQKLQAMKQYQEHIDRLNKAVNHRPKLLLIQKLNKMNLKIEELNKDNSELQQSLEDHQETLELIMNKYKEQTEKLTTTAQLEASSASNNLNSAKDMEEKDAKIHEMASVMMVASERWGEDEGVTNERRRLISLLQQKNRLMRMVLLNTTDEMLKIESTMLDNNLTDGLDTSLDIKTDIAGDNTNNTNNNSRETITLGITNASPTTTDSTPDAFNADEADKSTTSTRPNITNDILHNTLTITDITPVDHYNNTDDNPITCIPSNADVDSNNDENRDDTNRPPNDISAINETLKTHQETNQADKISTLKPQVYIYSDADFHEASNSESETICDETLTRGSEYNVSMVTLS